MSGGKVMRIRDEQLINRFLEFMDDYEIKSIVMYINRTKSVKNACNWLQNWSVSCWENRIGN